MSYYLFPFEKISPNTNVIIYGAGVLGQWFVEQIKRTRYANIVLWIDEQWERYIELEGIDPIERINEVIYDYIVIAINDEHKCQEIKEWLNKDFGINSEIIILGCNRRNEFPVIKRPTLYEFTDEAKLAFRKNIGLSMALWCGTGIGDNIIFKRKIDEILKWDDSITVDLYTVNGFGKVIHSLYNGEYGGRINHVFEYDRGLFQKYARRYSVAIVRENDIYIYHINENEFSANKPLLDKFLTIRTPAIGESEFNPYDAGLHYARCKIKKLWAYTASNKLGGIQVKDFRTHIPLDAKFETVFKGLNLGKYITMTCGFDIKGREDNKQQTKVWPTDNFNQLALLIKQKYPNLKIIQVDSANTNIIDKCDLKFLGENLELIKHILKNACLTISIEGGIVHLATQLGTKCAVLFGPTSMEYYGYNDNINISNGECHGCLWLKPYNHYECLRELEKPECMYSITPGLVMNRISSWIEKHIVRGEI